MKPLDSDDSKKLFFSRVFGFEDGCPSQYEKVSAEILKKCGGLPLAIITIASLLACRPARIMQEQESIRNSLGTPFGTNPRLEGMRQILNLSYKNLPLHLGTCFLYLGKKPEDYSINRDEVWIAEGFVRNSPGQNLEDVGKSYFNELINRGLIQLEQNHYKEVMGCRVHDMILSRCKDDNFISVAYSGEDYVSIARQHGGQGNSCSPAIEGRFLIVVSLFGKSRSETLEIDCAAVISIPLDIVSLPCLSNQSLPFDVVTQHQVSTHSTHKASPGYGLEGPWELSLYFDRKESSTASNLDSLGSSIGKLQNPRYLEIRDYSGTSGDYWLRSFLLQRLR
uniref:Disease resistance protein winged helix domain-containing protein n=1 Tax=Oryza punctata TaxID=4537 RepID=A0A0E0LSA8_ORYPU